MSRIIFVVYLSGVTLPPRGWRVAGGGCGREWCGSKIYISLQFVSTTSGEVINTTVHAELLGRMRDGKTTSMVVVEADLF